MGRQRHAANPAGWNALMAQVANNRFTHSWNDAVTDGLIAPAERLLLGQAAQSRDTQMRLARAVEADLAAHGGVLSAGMQRLLQEHVDPAVDLARLDRASAVMDAAGLQGEERVVQLTTLLAQGRYRPGLVERGDVDARRTRQLREAVLAGQPRRASTATGELVRQYGLGSPLAAYGAAGVAAAGLLAAAAALHEDAPQARAGEQPPAAPGGMPWA
ncbi:hypothetical protein CPCC7001_839 [Cyanobium sp. PCC 7001]|uniref:hypothetical protein n=1 Tax=Cyanobium sp. PCC 7001 TaxID=180281 RepID=UPI0001804CCF|nr:hypothetical protein [Cyanobium sp. PCC 7001]EDY37960.1 hypothetical protein CPCC7001_839 [Cyanobium sp. PCC 7001]